MQDLALAGGSLNVCFPVLMGEGAHGRHPLLFAVDHVSPSEVATCLAHPVFASPHARRKRRQVCCWGRGRNSVVTESFPIILYSFQLRSVG